MKLGQKILGGFGLILALLVVVAIGYHFILIKALNGYVALIEGEVAVAGTASEAKSLMLQCRRDEKDFLMRLDGKYIEMHAQKLSMLRSAAGKLSELGSRLDDPDVTRPTETILASVPLYGESFAKLVAAWKRRGLNHDSGLQGDFRKVVHNLEEELGGG